MIKFLKNVLIFLAIGYLIGELITRAYKLNADIPKFYKDVDGLIKNRPNQTGYYVNGNKWFINKYGHYGYEPKSLTNLITVIGDSYIENIMNPSNCHQAYLLANAMHQYDFFPCARSGASFIELMEMSKSLYYLNPKKQLLFVHHSDFIESIPEILYQPMSVQFSIATQKISYPNLSSNRIKDVLYNFKFAYFLYRKYIVSISDVSRNNRNLEQTYIDVGKIQSLLDYVKANYQLDNIILVFSPDSKKVVVDLVKDNNFQIIELKADNYKTWQLSNDPHWSCKGHEEAAKQVSIELKQLLNKPKIDSTYGLNRNK